MKIVQSLITQWNTFWFEKRSLEALAIFRIVLCFSLGFLYLSRHADIYTYYSESGILPKAIALDAFHQFYRPSWLLAIWPDSMLSLLHFSLIFGLFVLGFGIGGRFLNIILAFLNLAFLQRNFSVAFGADLIGNIFLLYLAGTQSCARYSILSVLFKKMPKNEVKDSDLFTNLFCRLIQIQLIIVYVYSGLEKLKGATWWDGTALWYVFANPQMVIFDMSWLRHFSLAIVLLSFMTIVFEIYFPALLLSRVRKWVLGFGILFHLGIGFLLSLWAFALVMLAPYILFLKENELSDLRQFCLKMIQSVFNRFGKA